MTHTSKKSFNKNALLGAAAGVGMAMASVAPAAAGCRACGAYNPCAASSKIVLGGRHNPHNRPSVTAPCPTCHPCHPCNPCNPCNPCRAKKW